MSALDWLDDFLDNVSRRWEEWRRTGTPIHELDIWSDDGQRRLATLYWLGSYPSTGVYGAAPTHHVCGTSISWPPLERLGPSSRGTE